MAVVHGRCSNMKRARNNRNNRSARKAWGDVVVHRFVPTTLTTKHTAASDAYRRDTPGKIALSNLSIGLGILTLDVVHSRNERRIERKKIVC